MPGILIAETGIDENKMATNARMNFNVFIRALVVLLYL
jgi:hypothetical protein